MKNAHCTLAAAIVAALWVGATISGLNAAETKQRPPRGNNPHPVGVGKQHANPLPAAPQQAKRPENRDHDGGPHHNFGRSPYYVVGSTYGYDPYYGYPYGYAYPSSYYYGYLPPLWISAENFYGPQAVQRFFGMDKLSQPRPAADVVVPPALGNQDVDAPEPKQGADRATNARANALAWKFIGFGDAQFAAGKYAEANVRYRKAAESAPQLADAWFRQGFALSATGRYDQAVKAIQRGWTLAPNWPKSHFDLKELYGDDELAKDAGLEHLAQVAEAKPNDANLLFLAGVHLYFDGQAERAEKFLQRAAALAAGNAQHIQAFWPNNRDQRLPLPIRVAIGDSHPRHSTRGLDMRRKKVVVNDLMQQGYVYFLTEPAGGNFQPDFTPDLTPAEMLQLGVFGGKYMTDCTGEFPEEWFRHARLCHKFHDPELNFFGINASKPLWYWQAKGWIYCDDPRGWFQWYCRYYLGRRCPDDARQIKRWKAMTRHIAQIEKNCRKGNLSCRRKQRQALLHWAYDSRKM